MYKATHSHTQAHVNQAIHELSHTHTHIHTHTQVGKRVWDDYAEQAKIDREKKKYPPQEIIGFRIIGMRVSLTWLLIRVFPQWKD